MSILVVVNNRKRWPFNIPGVEVVGDRSYLTETEYSQRKGTKVFNLCRSYAYQSLGYYVSLLATARGQKVMPSISTIQDMKSPTIVRFVSDDLDATIQQSLAHLQSKAFVLSIYFGRNLAKRYDRLSLRLFNQFQAPMLRAHFVRNDKWTLTQIRPISVSEVPDSHRHYLVQFAQEHFAKRRTGATPRKSARYEMAILVNPEEKAPPSDDVAIQRFVRAASSLGIRAERITKDDYGHLSEYDALFIRETTQVNHHTYRFAQRAEAEGLVTVDDPESIVRCTNKVYLAEVLLRQAIPIPKTVVVHKDNVDAIADSLGFPCVLKRPDSSFSQGVRKVENEEDLGRAAGEFLAKSDLFVAQEFLPTTFDWRVGIFDGHPLWVCKYHMARDHWQIINWEGSDRTRYGRVESLPVEMAPRAVVRTALRAARLMGNGLYGVDLKQDGRRVYVIEVNDNPTIESAIEDAILKQELYLRIMGVFAARLERKKFGSRWA